MRNKIASLMLTLAMIMGIIPLSSVSVSAATSKVTYGASVSLGDSTDQLKYVDGNLAFCLESSKHVPLVVNAASVYNNPQIAKILYYGWGGPKQWSGFSGQAEGYIVTSRALSDAYSGTDHKYMTKTFLAYVNSQPAPPSKKSSFNKEKLSVKYDAEKDVQVSDTATVTGDSDSSVTFTVPNEVMLVKDDGTKIEGKVTLKVGESFHFEAPPTVSGTWNSGNVGENFKYQPLIFKATSNQDQDLTYGKVISDSNTQSSFSVTWLDFGSLEVTKISEGSKLLDGMKFELFSEDPNTGHNPAKVYAVENGKIRIDHLVVGKYTLTEIKTPEGHRAIKKVFDIEIRKDEKVSQIIVNKLAPKGELVIKKSDSETGKALADAEFTLYADEDIYDGVTFELLYKEGKIIDSKVTGEDGVVAFEELPMGKYRIDETKVPDGYLPIINKELLKVEFRQSDYSTKLYKVEKSISNTPTTVEVRKVDAYNSKEIEGAKMQLFDKEGKLIEEWASTKEAHIIKGLTFGEEYTLHEDLAPVGYKLAQDIKFKVGQKNRIVVKDEPKEEIVNTGDNSTLLLYSMLLAIALTSVIVIVGIRLKRLKQSS